ncbi:MAG: phage terminase large subunit family protein [Clostridia bacterium]|jgi:hypothetical protein
MKLGDNGFSALFEQFRDGILNVDPVYFCQKNLRVDGKPLKLNGTGYKPFADIYRYIALTAIEPNTKPIVLVKGRQVGATTMAAALECYFLGCGLFGTNDRPPMRIMHLFPTLSLAAAYTKDKFDHMTGQSRQIPGTMKSNGMPKTFMEMKMDTTNPGNNNMHFKKFLYGNQIWIESTGLDGNRVRGRTVDAAFFDEVQDINDIAIGAVTKILAQSHYGPSGSGVQVYFGTPKVKGGSYWNMWQSSSQNYFHLRCEKCGEYFPLYRPDIKWEDVWIFGLTVRCIHCKHEQNKLEAQERGKWIPLNDPDKSDFVGYHINQLYIPGHEGAYFTRETIDKAKPDRNPINTERIYMNEVLGEFYDGEGGTITVNEIHEKCSDKNRKMAKYISQENNKKVYAGFDWGQKGTLEQMTGSGKGKGSYSCGVILTIDGTIFNVEFATRLMRVEPEFKMQTVEEMYRRYNISLAVGDIGDAFDLTHKLQRTYNEKFLASRASHRITGHIKYSEDEWPKTIIFEKDYYISELLGLLKDGRIKFPYKDYYRISWLIEHCASMDIKVTRDKSGEPLKKYVKGTGANDGLMALLNAYIAWKFDVTQGFKIKEPQFMKYESAQQAKSVQAVIGFVPRLFSGRG